MRYLLIVTLLFGFLTSHSQRRVVVQEHDNGEEHVVLYVKGKGKRAEKVKQEVYFENGQLDFYGEFDDGVEHGEWVYYYEDGTVLAIENYNKGREDGVWKEYHPDGQLLRETYWDKGMRIKVVEY